jgi:uncharacterized membrane protein
MLIPVLLLLYPFLVHLSVTLDSALSAFAAIFILGLLALGKDLLRGSVGAWIGLGTVAGAGYFICTLGGGMYILFLPPVLISLMMLVFFGRTLRPGSVPIISRISESMRRAPLSPEVARYTRRVTVMWVWLFGLLAVEGAALAVFAPLYVWSLFTNFIDYVLIGAVMVVEYLYHSRRYPNQTQHSFVDFVRDLTRVDYRRLLED